MNKINSKVLEIKNDFLIKNLKNSKKLNFLKKISKSPDKQKFIFDDYKKVESFFKDWKKISKKFPTKWID